MMRDDSYRREEAALREDPIIRHMAKELREEGMADAFLDAGPSDYKTMTATMNEYKRRGGTLARSMGGPHRALYDLLLEADVEAL